MKRWISLIAITVAFVSPTLHASGTLYREATVCQGPCQRYFVSWLGPWAPFDPVWLQISTNGQNWQTYVSNIVGSGCITSPITNRYYIVAGCWSGQSCVDGELVTSIVHIPDCSPCQGDPN